MLEQTGNRQWHTPYPTYRRGAGLRGAGVVLTHRYMGIELVDVVC